MCIQFVFIKKAGNVFRLFLSVLSCWIVFLYSENRRQFGEDIEGGVVCCAGNNRRISTFQPILVCIGCFGFGIFKFSGQLVIFLSVRICPAIIFFGPMTLCGSTSLRAFELGHIGNTDIKSYVLGQWLWVNAFWHTSKMSSRQGEKSASAL